MGKIIFDDSIELFIPPREYLGDLIKTAKIDLIYERKYNVI